MASRLTEGKALGNETAGFVKAAGFRGFVHSDEDMVHYKMVEDMVKVREQLGCTGEDLVALFSGSREEAARCFGLIQERVRQLADGVTKDTRKALETGDTDYLRPLPGAGRLYPETDLGPVEVSQKTIEKIALPETLSDKKKRLIQLGLNEELAGQLIGEGMDGLFEELTHRGWEPKLVAVALTGLKTEVEREEKKELGRERVKEIFEAMQGKQADKNTLKKIFSEALRQPEKKGAELAGSGAVDEAHVVKTVCSLLEKNPGVRKAQNPESALMALAMKELRGKAGGAVVMAAVRKVLGK